MPIGVRGGAASLPGIWSAHDVECDNRVRQSDTSAIQQSCCCCDRLPNRQCRRAGRESQRTSEPASSADCAPLVGFILLAKSTIDAAGIEYMCAIDECGGNPSDS